MPSDDAALLRSAPIAGLTADPDQTLRELFDRYVAARDRVEQRTRRKDSDVWSGFAGLLKAKNVLGRMTSHTVKGNRYEEHFEHAWQNGRWNVAKPLSFDLLDPHEIPRKAASWTGRILTLHPAEEVGVHLLIGMPGACAPADLRQAAADALGILKEELEDQELAQVIPESEAHALADKIADDILAHDVID